MVKKFNIIMDKSIFALKKTRYTVPLIVAGLLLITLLDYFSWGTVAKYIFLLYGFFVIYTTYYYDMKAAHWVMGASFLLNLISQLPNIVKLVHSNDWGILFIEKFLIVILYLTSALLFSKFLLLEREAKDRYMKTADVCRITSRELAEANASINELYVSTIKALASAIEVKDPYTRGHSDRVTKYAVAIAREMHLKPEEIRFIMYAAILHDIGKIGIDEAILKKPGLLTAEEYDQIKKHPGIGSSIISSIKFLQPIMPIVLHHHEYYDGTGYPGGKKGAEIPIGARILAVVDSFDAMIYDRPYRKGLTREQALERVIEGAGTQFDPNLVEVLVKILKKEDAGKHLTDEVKNITN